MQYNKADQLTLWPGMYSYTYYPDGSMQCVKNPSGSATLRSYTYTPAGLLASASYGGRTFANTWDADSNRVGMDANGSEYAFVYDTTAGVPAVIAEVQPHESVVYYYREPDGSLITRRDGSDWRYYHLDALGSTRLITDSYGYVTDAYAYDAYGALLSHDRYSGSIDQPYQYVGRHGYYAHYQEPDFGLLQLGVRYYDPTIGRFTQKDRLTRHGRSAYIYTDDQPISLADPSGFLPWASMALWCVECHKCVAREREDAAREQDTYQRHLLSQGKLPYNPYQAGYRDNGRDMHNAVAHCVAGCHIYQTCGKACAALYLTAWEAWFPREDRYWDSITDLHNRLGSLPEDGELA